MPARKKPKKRRQKRILPIPKPYVEAIKEGTPAFSPLFQFENALRLVVDRHMQTCYGPNWWDTKVQHDLPRTYQYAEDVKQSSLKMPWIGASSRVATIPLHAITLGQLEEIIIYYRADCIPAIFHRLDFFTGHMDVIKRVRNLFSHMHPCIDNQDVRVLKREITTLCDDLRSKL